MTGGAAGFGVIFVLINEKSSLLDTEVIAASQKLDEAITTYLTK